ncbi:MAG: valine--tRNA ligase [Ferrovibrionaceae bacterium]
MLDKTYRPEEVETRLYAAWEDAGAFACGQNDNKPFSIVIPPPNVTGSLHMGHALNNTLQDILIRFERMRGRDVLWQPGTDHAGIATQMVVERQLEQFQQTRRSLGREKFLEKVWEWKAESGGTITRQLRRLGASCDWSRERFTMDEGLSAAVRKVFVELYRQGLIYKDKRLVNWDIKFQTAISDLEVEAREVKGNLWHIAYPIEGSDERITVATTRPETMLGDTGIAVHPDDERFKHLVGRHAILPLVGRRIPIVADSYSDPEKGTGAVKMTPAHDFNDFEVGRRHGLDMIVVLDREGHINENGPEAYRGLKREDARKRIVADLEEQGYLVKVEPHVHTVPHGDRSGLVIEPYLTDQWYVDAATLAKPAIEAVETGAMTFVPRQWEKTYFEWMRNIQPWCISRQLWWGHQIPAWYAPDGKVFVAETEGDAQAQADAHYGQPTALARDEDVLDTWFSSALWPFSTLGWPEKTPELARYYQTDVVVTGFDIIFFWVARMAMMGLHFMGEAPFHTIYIHALVRDEKGQKMSKSKGNVIDPLVLIDKYGADAMRFTLTAMAAQGRDIKLAESRVEGYRNFCTKLWNASRFAEMNGCDPVPGFDPAKVAQTVNRWIVGATVRCGAAVTQAIEAYRYNEAAGALYQFAWGTYCDWYLEFIKPVLMGADGPAKDETRATCAWVLERLLELMHPIMPFVTEELWQRRYQPVTGGKFLMQRPWPDFSSLPVDQAAFDEMEWVIRLISEVRTTRNEMNVPAAAKIPLFLNGASGLSQSRLATHRDAILRLARLEDAAIDGTVGQGAVQIVLDEATVVLPLADVIDIAKERERLAKEKAKAEAEIAKIDGRMANADFVAKAPAHVLEENNERKVNFSATIARLDEALKRLA